MWKKRCAGFSLINPEGVTCLAAPWFCGSSNIWLLSLLQPSTPSLLKSFPALTDQSDQCMFLLQICGKERINLKSICREENWYDRWNGAGCRHLHRIHVTDERRSVCQEWKPARLTVECSSGGIFLSESDWVQETSSRARPVSDSHSAIYVPNRQSFKLKHWVCVTQLLLLWLQPVYLCYACLVFRAPCKLSASLHIDCTVGCLNKHASTDIRQWMWTGKGIAFYFFRYTTFSLNNGQKSDLNPNIITKIFARACVD